MTGQTKPIKVSAIKPEALAALIRKSNEQSSSIRENRKKLVIVDVREHDFVDTQIFGSINIPACEFDAKLEKFVGDLIREGEDMVYTLVFHCFYSQSRGPTCARIFCSYINENHLSGCFQKTANFKLNVDRVYVLEGGYSQWQNMYSKYGDLVRKIKI